jgi:hypothetical protein
MLSAPAFAGETLKNLLSILRDKGTITQDEYNALIVAANNEEQGAKKAVEKPAAQAETPASGWWDDTKVSGRMYYNFSYINNKRSGVRQSNSGTGFDIKRFYVGIDHKFNDIFSGNVTTDFTYDSNAGATQVYIKKAYLDARISKALDLRLGSTDLPWVPFVEGIYGYRYVENVMIDRTKFGTSADWGLHANGKLGDGTFQYAVSVVNGAGYKHPGVHSNTIDFEGRLSANWNNFILGVGGYVGKLGKNPEGATTYHTANRFDAIGAYKTSDITLGIEYFYAKNWANITSPTSDTAEGVSVFGSYKFNPEWALFGRYDYVKPNKDTNSSLNDDYFNVGIAYSPARIVDFSLVYKRDHAGDGNLNTGNGRIGGLTAVDSGTYDEVGLFGRFRW